MDKPLVPLKAPFFDAPQGAAGPGLPGRDRREGAPPGSTGGLSWSWGLFFQRLVDALWPGQVRTTATEGFVLLPTCEGTPTGIPAVPSGAVALVFDTTARKLWIYSGAWRGVALRDVAITVPTGALTLGGVAPTRTVAP